MVKWTTLKFFSSDPMLSLKLWVTGIELCAAQYAALTYKFRVGIRSFALLRHPHDPGVALPHHPRHRPRGTRASTPTRGNLRDAQSKLPGPTVVSSTKPFRRYFQRVDWLIKNDSSSSPRSGRHQNQPAQKQNYLGFGPTQTDGSLPHQLPFIKGWRSDHTFDFERLCGRS